MRQEIRKIQELMEAADYVTDAPVATAVHLAMTLRKPLLIEGHAGVGKTEVAKVMARMLGTNLIRLQCYEGLDASTALYEWNYQKQLLHIKLQETSNRPPEEKEQEIFSEPFLLRRPLLQAITQTDQAPVLLVDEVDRCVAARTLITTTQGVKRAESIQAGDEVVSFDPDAFRIARSTVKRVVRREAPAILRILVGGRLLEVTPEHKFIRFTDRGHEVARASELRVGDRLPLYKQGEPPRVDEPRFDFSDSMLKSSDAGRRLLHSAYRASGKTYAELSQAVGVSRNHLRNVIQPRPQRASLRAGILGKLSAQLPLDGVVDAPGRSWGLRVRQSVSFHELLGYIVADGCFTSDRLCISDKDRANLDAYAGKFRESFGVQPRILRGPHRNYELTVHSLPLGRFLKRVLGAGMIQSRERIVPEFVFALAREKRAAFVRGFFDGEGWVGDHQVSATLSSPYLLAGIQHLLTSLGIDSHMSIVHVRAGSVGTGPSFTLRISDMRAYAKAVGFCAPAKRARLEECAVHRFTRTETLPRYQVARPLDELRGRRVRELALGEVTSIEVIEAPQPVYDLVLDGQPYFVANQVLTHNCDEEFEAFLLEIFSEWQITIPEVGTIKAAHPPSVILTSNRARELSDALRRRCLYLWVDYPPFEKEVRIVERKVPGVNARVAREIARFMETLRTVRLAKVPGVAESLDWAQALTALHADHLDAELVAETLGCVLKDADDIKRFRTEVANAGLGKFIPIEG